MEDESSSHVKYIVDRVHKPICEHVTISDVKNFLDKNSMENVPLERIESRLCEKATLYTAKVSFHLNKNRLIFSPSRISIEFVCVKNLFLDHVWHCCEMNESGRHLAPFAFSKSLLHVAVIAFNGCWVGPV